ATPAAERPPTGDSRPPNNLRRRPARPSAIHELPSPSSMTSNEAVIRSSRGRRRRCAGSAPGERALHALNAGPAAAGGKQLEPPQPADNKFRGPRGGRRWNLQGVGKRVNAGVEGMGGRQARTNWEPWKACRFCCFSGGETGPNRPSNFV